MNVSITNNFTVNNRMRMMMTFSKAALIQFKKQLEAMKAETIQISASTVDARAPVTLDQSMVGRLSRMDALQDQAMQLELERRRKNELKRIQGALNRITDNSFGECVRCGEDISPERLQQDPTAPICIECARGS